MYFTIVISDVPLNCALFSCRLLAKTHDWSINEGWSIDEVGLTVGHAVTCTVVNRNLEGVTIE
jgi:hypothetical protein